MAMVSLQSCYDQARQALAQGEHDKAKAICQHVLQYYPQDLGTFQLLGQINLEQKRATKAREYFGRVLDIDPENVSAHWGMGIAYQDEGSLEQAVVEFEQALEIKPDLSDLRSQLLRLYTELYGASRAQLHLSRAGLGRLYIKGEMLDKAIEEFREVLKVDPSRVDVQSSLLEALWQRGRLEEARRIGEAVLERLPHALKANLIVGYLRMNEGQQEEGEDLWRKAVACDPNNTMARVLFEAAPVRLPQGILTFDAATLPEFDEEAWRARPVVEEELAEEIAILPEEEEALAVAEELAALAEPEAPSAEQAEPVGVSWLDSLATGEGVVEEPEEEELVPGLAPFSLEDMEGAPIDIPEEAEAMVSPEEGITPVEPELPEEEVVPVGEAEEQVMSPFSLEDLGLSPEEIAGLEEAVAATREEAAAPTEARVEEFAPEEEVVPGLQPFSLEEEPAPTAAEEELIPGVAPFSLDLEEEVTVAAGEEEMVPGLEPFSLDLEAEPMVAAEEEEMVAGVAPFSVEPFSFEDITGEAVGVEGVPGGVRPFSLEDLGLEEPTTGIEGVSLDDLTGDIGEIEPAIPAFSWQEPGMRRSPAFREDLTREEDAAGMGPSLFEKMMAGRREVEDLGEGEALEVAEEAAEFAEEALAPEAVEPFSLEAMGLEEVVPAEAVAGEEPLAPLEEEVAVAGVEPFSLEELQLEEPSPAEEEVAVAGVEPFSLEELGLEEPVLEAVVADVEGLEPFSLEELGVEAAQVEEMAEALGVAEEAAVAPMGDVLQPFTLEELGLTAEEIAGLGLEEEELVPAEAVEEALEAEAVTEAVEEVAVEVVEEVVEEEVILEEVAVAAEAGYSLEELREQLKAGPTNEGLRLQLARACAEQGEFDESVEHYRKLVKTGTAGLEDEFVADLQSWMGREQDPKRLHRLHRLLGDVYMKQGLYQQAISEYAWVLGR